MASNSHDGESLVQRSGTEVGIDRAGAVDGDAATNAMTVSSPAVLRRDLTVLPLGEDLILFSEEAQCILGLNPSASLVLEELQRGTSEREIIGKLAAIAGTPEAAEEWLSTIRGALASHGLMAGSEAPALKGPSIPDDRWSADRIATMPPYAPFSAVAEKRYLLLETCALIRYSHRGQLRMVDAVIGHLATDASREPTVTIELAGLTQPDGFLRTDVYRDKEPVAYAARQSMIGPTVKGVLWQTAINAHDFLFYIHAGVVGTPNGCILLPAQAGSGKSSLTAALIHRGFRYFSDEVALIQRADFRVPAMPLAICVKSTAWDLMAKYYPNITEVPMHWRDDGKRVRYLPPINSQSWMPAPVTHIVFPCYNAEAQTVLQPMSRSDALGRLMGECLALRQRLDYGIVQQLVTWMKEITCYNLTFSSLDAAADAVTELTKTKLSA